MANSVESCIYHLEDHRLEDLKGMSALLEGGLCRDLIETALFPVAFLQVYFVLFATFEEKIPDLHPTPSFFRALSARNRQGFARKKWSQFWRQTADALRAGMTMKAIMIIVMTFPEWDITFLNWSKCFFCGWRLLFTRSRGLLIRFRSAFSTALPGTRS